MTNLAKGIDTNDIVIIGADTIFKGVRVTMCYVRPQTAFKFINTNTCFILQLNKFWSSDTFEHYSGTFNICEGYI